MGEFDAWMDLATDSKDKAHKLLAWIQNSRVLNTNGIDMTLQAIENGILALHSLQTQFLGIIAAQTDILVGVPKWWRYNSKGVSKIFSAIAIIPHIILGWRSSEVSSVFGGLFTAEEIHHELSGNDMEQISSSFLNRPSIKTNQTWIRLAIAKGESGCQEWFPISSDHQPRHIETLPQEFLAGVFNLRSMHKDQTSAKTKTTPRKYINIHLRRDSLRGFTFTFKCCNTVANIKRQESTIAQPIHVPKDETGRCLVQTATFLGSIFDPGTDIIEYRTRLLNANSLQISQYVCGICNVSHYQLRLSSRE